jgi:hypothetical protein
MTQVCYLNPASLPDMKEASVVKLMMVTLLIGINMAATMGLIVPCAASAMPIRLYSREIAKLTLIMRMADLE